MYYWLVARQNPVLPESSSGPKPDEAWPEHAMISWPPWLLATGCSFTRTALDELEMMGWGSRVVLSQWSRDRSALV